MGQFREAMLEQQLKWRKINLPWITENGIQNGRKYEHILPRKNKIENFYPPIRSGLFEDGVGYIEKNKIQPHTGIHNLLSSWVLCANLYWPFRNADGFKILGEYLSYYTGIDIYKIEAMELEYEEEALSPQEVLGEDVGIRGSGQTSPDLAIKFSTKNAQSGILLIESKFTEHSFYSCSGYNKTKPGKPVNPDKKRCHKTQGIIQSDFQDCHLIAWGRKYWDLLKGDLDYAKYGSLKKCPMASCCYQLFRQQALAKGFRNKYDIVVSCVTVDPRNTKLISLSSTVGLKPFPDGWKELFPNSPFQWLTHIAWFEFVKSHNESGRWDDWIRYVEERYFEI